MNVGGVLTKLRHRFCIYNGYSLGRYMVAQTRQPSAVLRPNIECCLGTRRGSTPNKHYFHLLNPILRGCSLFPHSPRFPAISIPHTCMCKHIYVYHSHAPVTRWASLTFGRHHTLLLNITATPPSPQACLLLFTLSSSLTPSISNFA